MFTFHYALSESPTYPLAEGGNHLSRRGRRSCKRSGEHLRTQFRSGRRGELNVEDYPLQIVHPSVFR